MIVSAKLVLKGVEHSFAISSEDKGITAKSPMHLVVDCIDRARNESNRLLTAEMDKVKAARSESKEDQKKGKKRKVPPADDEEAGAEIDPEIDTEGDAKMTGKRKHKGKGKGIEKRPKTEAAATA